MLRLVARMQTGVTETTPLRSEGALLGGARTTILR